MERKANNVATNVLQIIILGVVGWVLVNMIDLKERMVRIEYQLLIRKVENK